MYESAPASLPSGKKHLHLFTPFSMKRASDYRARRRNKIVSHSIDSMKIGNGDSQHPIRRSYRLTIHCLPRLSSSLFVTIFREQNFRRFSYHARDASRATVLRIRLLCVYYPTTFQELTMGIEMLYTVYICETIFSLYSFRGGRNRKFSSLIYSKLPLLIGRCNVAYNGSTK